MGNLIPLFKFNHHKIIVILIIFPADDKINSFVC